MNGWKGERSGKVTPVSTILFIMTSHRDESWVSWGGRSFFYFCNESEASMPPSFPSFPSVSLLSLCLSHTQTHTHTQFLSHGGKTKANYIYLLAVIRAVEKCWGCGWNLREEDLEFHRLLKNKLLLLFIALIQPQHAGFEGVGSCQSHYPGTRRMFLPLIASS